MARLTGLDDMEMLLEIDESGKNLTNWETTFVADLIDRGIQMFTVNEQIKIQQVYEERVPE